MTSNSFARGNSGAISTIFSLPASEVYETRWHSIRNVLRRGPCTRWDCAGIRFDPGSCSAETPVVAFSWGERSAGFPEERATDCDLLKTGGFPVRYTEWKNHHHNYYAVSMKVNADAWEFSLGQHLP